MLPKNYGYALRHTRLDSLGKKNRRRKWISILSLEYYINLITRRNLPMVTVHTP